VSDKVKEILENKDEETKQAARRKSKLPQFLTKKERKKLGVGKDEAQAIYKYARISSRKIKIVLDLIRGKGLNEIYGILKFTPKAASPILYKLVKSAAANAENKNLDIDSLFLAEGLVTQGPTLKRIMPRAQGRAARIHKRTSHITVVLREKKKK
jgi:large subunit ribosomal protein L22